MNYIDVIIVIFLSSLAIFGYFRGAFRELGDIVITGFSILFAVLLFQKVCSFIHLPAIIPLAFVKSASFFLVWFISEIVLYLLFFSVLNRVPLSITDSNYVKYFGPVLAIVKGSLVIVLALSIALLLPLGKDLEKDFASSAIVKIVSTPTGKTSGWFATSFGQAEVSDDFITLSESKQDKVQLGYRLLGAKESLTHESQITSMLNADRNTKDIEALKLDDKLSAIALAHATDLAKSGYLSHTSSDAKSLTDRLSAEGGLLVGENIAVGKSSDLINTGMLENSADSSNILSLSYKKVGIAVVDLGLGGMLVVEEFSS